VLFLLSFATRSPAVLFGVIDQSSDDKAKLTQAAKSLTETLFAVKAMVKCEKISPSFFVRQSLVSLSLIVICFVF
jgi:hypothetical protein